MPSVPQQIAALEDRSTSLEERVLFLERLLLREAEVLTTRFPNSDARRVRRALRKRIESRP